MSQFHWNLEGFPAPDSAPEAGACIRLERPEPGLVRLHLDPPHRKKIAVFDKPLLEDLKSNIDVLEQDHELRALIITGRNPLSFAAGADVEGLARLEDAEAAGRMVASVQGLFERIHRLGRTGGGRLFTVAAVGGPIPGGACEIALACDRILMCDDDSSRIGLPEVLLGILPAWGGSTRLPRRVGVPAALEAILSGRLLRAKKARRIGLVDRTTQPELLWSLATEIAMERLPCPHRGRRGWRRVLIDRNPAAGAIIASKAREGIMQKTHGHYPAPLAVLPLVVRAPRISLDKGLRAELQAVGPLARGPEARGLLSVFLASEAGKKSAMIESGDGAGPVKAPRITRAGVVGAGVMGGAIAGVMAEKGVDARLADLSQEALDRAEGEHRKSVEKKRKRRRMTRSRASAAIDRLTTSDEIAGFDRCELVVEAVAERLDVKRTVLGALAAQMPDDAILATNTSSLSVNAMAEGLPHPERLVGMHFFNPVRLMPMVEVVRGEQTDPAIAARVARLALDLGKTPVIVADVPGFLVNRILGPYMDEAIRMVAGGADPEAVDAALVSFGMPMGPIELIDEVGLDIASHAADSLFEAYGERMQKSAFLAPLVEAGHLGKKTGAGIYTYKTEKGKPKRQGLNSALPARSSESTLAVSTIAERLILAMVNEAARALEEGVVENAALLDLATVFGTGFAPFRGGVLRHADSVGAERVVDDLRRFHDAPDVEGRRSRFQPAAILEDLAARQATFHES